MSDLGLSERSCFHEVRPLAGYETCCCGARFSPSSWSIVGKERERQSFREAHKDCHARTVGASDEHTPWGLSERSPQPRRRDTA